MLIDLIAPIVMVGSPILFCVMFLGMAAIDNIQNNRALKKRRREDMDAYTYGLYARIK